MGQMGIGGAGAVPDGYNAHGQRVIYMGANSYNSNAFNGDYATSNPLLNRQPVVSSMLHSEYQRQVNQALIMQGYEIRDSGPVNFNANGTSTTSDGRFSSTSNSSYGIERRENAFNREQFNRQRNFATLAGGMVPSPETIARHSGGTNSNAMADAHVSVNRTSSRASCSCRTGRRNMGTMARSGAGGLAMGLAQPAIQTGVNELFLSEEMQQRYADQQSSLARSVDAMPWYQRVLFTVITSAAPY